ncbi:MAG TPA: TonB-dependent receptor [Kofleriaceae bacterium]|nr:TonB-dependent receptor [Kofleriaceae bacterium]
MKRIGISFVMGLGLLTAAQVIGQHDAYAQSNQTGAVRGRIIDKKTKEPIIGATVVATGPALQGQQAEITDESGNYQIENLPPGNYVLTVYYNDAQFSRPNVTIELGKQAFVQVAIDSQAAAGETIELTGRAPIVDQGSTKTGTTITDEYTTHIPVGRTFGAVLGTAAGTQNDQYGVSFSGATSVESTYIVEGLNTTDTAFGGQSTNLPNEFVQETEVIAGGYNAEFGRSTGGVVNVVTKQGGNQFHGSVFAYYTPGQLVADADSIVRQASAIGHETNLNYDADVGAEIGGPIIKDKLWFHVGINPSYSKSTVTRIISRNVDKNQDGEPDVDPDNGLEVTEEVSRNDMSTSTRTGYFTAKINGALSPDHQFQISAFGNPTSTPRAFYIYTGDRYAQLYALDEGSYDGSIKWTSKFADNKTQIDAVAGYHRAYNNQLPYFQTGYNGGDTDLLNFNYTRQLSDFRQFEANLYPVPGVNTLPGIVGGCDDQNLDPNDPYPMIDNCPVLGYSLNGAGYLEQRDNDRLSGQISLTQRVRLAGHHTFKAGLDVEQTTYDSHRGYTGGAFWRQSSPFTGSSTSGVWSKRTLLVPDATNGTTPCLGGTTMCSEAGPVEEDAGGISADTANLSVAGYLQDSWQIFPNLSLNAGLRYEQQSGGVAKFLQGTTDPGTGETVPDTAFTIKNMWAPRIGVIYDPTQEGRAKIFGHWGRFYEAIPMDINVRAFGGEIINFAQIRPAESASDTRPICPQAAGAQTVDVLESCPVYNPASSQSGGGIEIVANSTRGQYISEGILGAEYELMQDFKMGVNYVHRNLPVAIEDMSTDGGTTYFVANPGENFDDEAADWDKKADDVMATDPDLADVYRTRASNLRSIKNLDKPQRNYDAIQITANQRFSKNAMLLASYTYSRSFGNYPGLFSTETGQLDPNLTSMYDLPDLMANRYGPMGLDRPHSLKVDGFYQFDFKKAGLLILGASFRGQSGIAHNTLAGHWAYGLDESYLLPRGSANRSPFTWTADLQVDYGRKINKTQSLEAFVDVFNLFNNQAELDADERYTTSNANPIVNGDASDLKHSKTLDVSGMQVNSSPVLDKNYGNLNDRQAPLSVRFGLRYTF